MRCEDVRELLPGFLDADIEEAGEVDEHLGACVDCRAELEAYRTTLAELAVLADTGPIPPPALAARAIAAIPERKLSEWFRGSVREHPLAYAAGIAGAALAAAAVTFAIRRSRVATRPTAAVVA